MVIVGNLVWRVLCEIWIVLFNIHNLLGSIEGELGQVAFERVLPSEEQPVGLQQDVREREQAAHVAGHPASVLGLS